MARPNRPRTVGTEDSLAQRIRQERERRGWTYDALAARMERVGCAIQPSAIYKVEKGKPRRRVTVDELVALANVFEVELADLLLPLELIDDREARALLQVWLDAFTTREEAEQAEARALGALRAHVEARPATFDALSATLRTWVGQRRAGAAADSEFAYWTARLRGDEAELQQAADAFVDALLREREAD